MRFLKASSAAAIASSLAIAVNADTEIEHPNFEQFTKQLSSDSFFEQFNESSLSTRWKISHATKKDTEEFVYNGEWSIEESEINPGFKNDLGLVVKSEAAHHAIYAPLPSIFNNTDNTLVLQYEVKLQNGLNCGGAYIKLLSFEGGPDDSNEFNNDTPYQIMFGPDKCGMTNKVHFIIKRLNPITGEYEEKHLQTPPMSRIVKTSSLYTLIIKPNQDFEIRINGQVAKAGSLLDPHYFKMDPPLEIEDPNDFKPDDWIDDEFIPDLNAVKPDDWDESEPIMIDDPNAIKPSNWDENASELISDPNAIKPIYWDDEEDGEWTAPKILNPECENHGCGPWLPPRIKNPKYKGKWTPPLIENPEYKGEWQRNKIPNPNYYHDSNPSNLESIGSIGFELWTMTNSILFDNIYLGHSIKEAEEIGNLTFIPKLELEELESSSTMPKPKFEPESPPSSLSEISAFNEIYEQVQEAFELFLESAYDFINCFKNDPLNTLINRPGEAFFYIVVFVCSFIIGFGIWAVIISLIVGFGPSTPEVETEKEEEIVELIEESNTATESKINETEAIKR
ncbi:hypothetical protein CANARDRAFT_236811 [[Candida] arabinofermentans NRRL YB-2248]|uniref:Calnexin n=1 Tax=[Candida] arabinofermentans NRRL YB-2248 TaxID=983967 RepID=A0A1E4SWV8_9ASCO|nr:hypothetical protein CANARDRAFT_236811 [[Candida] arabinofermentans NRRL YB-2248]